MKKLVCCLIAMIMVMGLAPSVSIGANAAHVHVEADYWCYDDYGHWVPCYGGDNCEEKLNYQVHDLSEYSKYCSICNNRLDHICYNSEATCTYGGRCDYCPYGAPEDPDNHQGRYAIPIDEKTHKVVCYCDHVFVKSEPHEHNHWDTVEGNPDIEESWCETPGCLYVITREKQKPAHTHSYSKATCVSPAKCSCGATKGSKDSSNHTGGTIIKGATEATADKEGYTGDTYCKGCDAKIKSGNVIPKKAAVTTTTSGTEPATPDNKPTASGTEPATSGDNPTASGTEPATSGDNPTASGTEPATSGDNPTASGTEPATSDDNPTASDTEPATSDDEPAASDTDSDSPDSQPDVSDDDSATQDINSGATDSDSVNSVTADGENKDNEKDDKEDNIAATNSEAESSEGSESEEDSMLWLWILLIVIAVVGAVTVVFIVKKKR